MAMRKYVIAVFILWLICIGGVQAVMLSVVANKETYRPGDTIRITAGITNTRDSPADVVLDCQIRGREVSELDRYIPYPVSLAPFESQSIILFTIPVKNTTLSGVYSVLVQASSDGVREQDQEILFTIQDTLRDLTFLPLVCVDAGCQEESKVFVTGRRAFLGFSTPIQEVRVSGIITTPEGSQLQVSLPAEVPITQVGVYQLHLEATKSGYRTVTWNLQFAGIEEEPHIVSGAPRATATPVTVRTLPPMTTPTTNALDAMMVISVITLIGLFGRRGSR
jgi:hypothetical protein